MTKGFAGMKFSGSVNRFGVNRASDSRIRVRIRNPTRSFVE